MTLETFLQRVKTTPELEQAITRIIMAALTMIVLFFAQFFYENFYQNILLASTGYTLFSILWFLWVYHDSREHPYRHVLGMFFDLTILTFAMRYTNITSVGLYPIILWVIISNGFRYGVKYLYIALGSALILFQVATYENIHWENHKELIFMMSLGLVALSLLISRILYIMSSLNETLIENTKNLEYQLYHDDMTKLKNRVALNKAIDAELYDSLTLIDVNNFSHFNDLYGMDVGNEILKNLAKFLAMMAEKTGLSVYRLSGDSFVFLQQEEIAKGVYEEKILKIQEELSVCEMSIKGVKLKVNFTMVSVKKSENVLEKANMTLHFARKNGEKYWVYDESLDRKKEVENILFWEKEIYDAIIDDRIVPVFHPIVDVHGEIQKYEVLMRMEEKEDGKLHSPFKFLDIAMKTNQYEKLTTIMIEKSFAAMAKMESDFSINLTFSNIQNKEMVLFLKSMIDEYGLGDRLILEIVESEDIYNFEIVKTFVSYLRLLGVRFAIDDFGSGYSNYMHVFEVQPDYIKLDGSLIQVIDKDENAQKFVSSIVYLAKNLGVRTIAEFVYNKEIFEITKNLGVDEFQGSYFYKPLSLDILEEKF